MKTMKWIGVGLLAFGLIGGANAQGQNLNEAVRVDQNLNKEIPKDAEFKDEFGKTVTIGDYLGKKPVIISPIFYNCKGVCVMINEGLAKAVRSIKAYVPGRDYTVLSVSVHPKETPEIAAKKKAEVMEMVRKGTDSGWHFLTGSQENILKLTDALGFHYTYDPVKDLVAHPAAIMVITPEGKISRYFYGAEFSAPLVMKSLQDAASDKIGPKAEPIFWGCVQYDPHSGKYSMVVSQVIRIGGIATVLILALAISVMSYKSSRSKGGPARS
jgi:protein SCO1/2